MNIHIVVVVLGRADCQYIFTHIEGELSCGVGECEPVDKVVFVRAKGVLIQPFG